MGLLICLSEVTAVVEDAWRPSRPTYRGGRCFAVIRSRVAPLLDRGHASLRLTPALR